MVARKLLQISEPTKALERACISQEIYPEISWQIKYLDIALGKKTETD